MSESTIKSAETIGHWLGALPNWVQLWAIPLFVVLALLFVPVGGGDTLGTMILDLMTKHTGGNDAKK
jgi:hypothetical protein